MLQLTKFSHISRSTAIINYRTVSSTSIVESLRDVYAKSKKRCLELQLPNKVNPRAVFVNNEVDMHKIGALGFDYDYTLAVYTRQLNELIYNLAMNDLVTQRKYPERLVTVPYDIGFAIRGLHYDIDNACLLKVDAFNQIQKGTVYRGKRALKEKDVLALYGGFTLPDNKGKKLPQLIDLFSLPWAGLLATVVEYFDSERIEFDPTSLYNDVAASVQHVHVSGAMYRAVMADMDTYVHRNSGLGDFLHRVVSSGKELFMVTNSPNAGMTFMLGEEWRRYFKYVIVSSRKPGFFEGNAPFRLYKEESDSFEFEKVESLEAGRVYAGGNIRDFSTKAHFSRRGVMYFGDHIYTDLAGPMLELGWATAAVVPELAREIRIQNSEAYRIQVLWLETLSQLIEYHQKHGKHDREAENLIREWADERRRIRTALKFGSMFRTFHNPTFFCRRLNRLSDIYTSRLPNLLQFDDDHTFFPRRNALAHEPVMPFVEVCDKVACHMSEENSA